MTTLTINGAERTLDVDPDTPLLWVLRDELRLTGTKFGCGVAQCGACMVMLNGMPRRACVTPIRTLAGADVTTIEGMSGREYDAVQAACGVRPELPEWLGELPSRKERITAMPVDQGAIEKFILAASRAAREGAAA